MSLTDSNSNTPYTRSDSSSRTKGSDPSGPFGRRLVEEVEKSTKEKAYADLKHRQEQWKIAEKTVKDLKDVKDLSEEEKSLLEDAKRYLLINTRPQFAGRKTRRGKKKSSKKSRKAKGRR